MRRPLRVLVVSMQWDYGFPERGLSFEHTNMYDSMARLDGVDVAHLDFMVAYQQGGHDEVRRQLLGAVDDHRPDFVFFFLFKDEVPADVLVELRDRPGLITFNWFADDHWRFEDFTRHWAPLFNACSTTARSALPKYAALGGDLTVVKTQWACNHHLYRPRGSLAHDVTFVGQPHGNRREVIERMRSRGIPVEAWGTGWENGRAEQDRMTEVFATSRINLNLSNSSVKYGPLATKIVERGRPRRLFMPSGPIGRRLRTRRPGDQIKGRNFEIPGCGGFQLSGHSEDLESYYEPFEEIVIFRKESELHELARRYLADEAARARIAEAGYRRTLAEHTYEHRYREIFAKVGL